MAGCLHTRLRLQAGIRGSEAGATGGEKAGGSGGARTTGNLALVVFEMDSWDVLHQGRRAD
jgi:hypothetical protein